MEDLPPVDTVGKLIACQLPVHYVVHIIWNFRCFRVILEGAISYYYNQFIIISSLIF